MRVSRIITSYKSNRLNLLFTAVFAAYLPHTAHLALWIAAVCPLLLSWRLVLEYKGKPLPPALLRHLITVAGVFGVVVTYGHLYNRPGATALFVFMLGMKALEMKSRRDELALIFLTYFLILFQFLFSQTIFSAVYMTLVMLLVTASLLVYSRETRGVGDLGRVIAYSGRLLFQAAPLALLMFLLFPRLPGSLWGITSDMGSVVSGINDWMQPGSFTDLVLSNQVAFRAKFKGDLPPPNQRYWRVLVFWHTDGRRWAPGFPFESSRVYIERYGQPVRYTVTMEPHNHTWLMALDTPARAPYWGVLTHDMLLRARGLIRRRIRYDAVSYPNLRFAMLNPEQRARALEIPENSNPEAYELARQWKEELGDADLVVKRALRYFREQPFYYSLSPPLLGKRPVDEFLFNSRVGFCEHYASSFAYLMRSAGIPTRVVVGYLGGEVNPLGDYLIVRQSDAHAWVEVWLQGRGWVRIDPTAAVAPERILYGIEPFLPRDLPSLLAGRRGGWLGKAIRNLRWSWDAVNNTWNQWVLGYSYYRQAGFLRRLGIRLDPAKWMPLALIAGILSCLAVLGVLGLWLTRKKDATRDTALKLYRRFCGKLAHAGWVREPYEGPLDFARRVASARPDLSPEVDEISGLYVRLRYGRNPADSDMGELKKRVSGFDPSPGPG